MDARAAGALLPSVRQHVDEIAHSMEQHKSVWCMLPVGVNSVALRGEVEDALDRRGCHVISSDISRCASLLADPPRFLQAVTGHVIEDRSLSALMISRDVPEVMSLGDVGDLTKEEQELLVVFFESWCETAKTIADAGARPPCLLVAGCLQSGIAVPRSGLLSEVSWWWGIPSSLDVHLAVRYHSDNTDQAAGAWRESVIPSLAGCDTDLVDDVWQPCLASFPALVHALRSYPARRGWLRRDVAESDTRLKGLLESPTFRGSTARPPAAYREFWSEGLIGETPEFGIEVHSAILASLGRTDLIERRLWRGQAGLVLPLLDGIRMRVCGTLEDRYGGNWATRWDRPRYEDEARAVESDPMSADWGYLYHLLTNCRAFTTSRDLLQPVRLGRQVRNRVAHQGALEFADYKRLTELSEDSVLAPVVLGALAGDKALELSHQAHLGAMPRE